MIRAVTFDCALTLLDVNWQPDLEVCLAAEELGLEFDQQLGRELFGRLYMGRQRQLMASSFAGQDEYVNFWVELGEDWCAGLELPDKGLEVMQRFDDRIYGPNSSIVRLYDDVLPCLDTLREQGIPLGVISNWDRSLERVLNAAGIADRFETISASMVVGSEKPDTEIFELTLSRMGLKPSEVLHVGDNPLDDGEGARRAGIRSVIIDRSRSESEGSVIHHMSELMARI
jgi:putative hydrolase of the HAD superfamily